MRIAVARRRLDDDAGAVAPTPLFLAYVSALVLSVVAAFRGGIDIRSAVDFVLLASIVTGAVLVLFAGVMIWSTRARQRAAALAAARPGALVLGATRTRDLSRSVHALGAEVSFVPIGLTLLADETGIEVWAGSAEHPVRLGRAPWDAVVDIRVAGVTRWGRSIRGITVSVLEGAGIAELPFAVVGAGLGGLSVPAGERLEEIAAALRARQAESIHA